MNYSFLTMVLFWVVCGGVCSYIAKQRNRSPLTWFFIGLLFSLFGLLCLLLLPAKNLPVPEATSVPDANSTKLEGIKQMNNESAALEGGPSFPAPNTMRISRDTTIDWYFIDALSSIVGPMKLTDLRKALLAQKLDNQTFIWCEEFPDWMQIKQLQNGGFLLDPDFL